MLTQEVPEVDLNIVLEFCGLLSLVARLRVRHRFGNH